MEDVITIATNLSTKGFEKGSKALRQAINSLSRSAAQLGKSTARSATSILGSFRKLLPMILGVGSAYGIISKAVSSFMSQNEELASKMNSIWTALGNLIAPIMEKIINWVTTAVAYFLEFLRVLGVTGKTASQLSQKANKSTQELKKTLAGFDELNILQDNNDKNKDVGLPDVQLPEWLKNIADLLKGMKWDEAADLLIQKLNDLIQKLKEKAYEVGYTVGEYLGKGLSAIAKIIEGVDWRGIGETLANFVNGIFNNPNMKGEDLGTILVAKFTIAFKILTAFLENFDGEAIGKYLSGVIKGAFDSMDRAIQQANPQKMGENIANFFNNIDWDGIAVSVSTFLNDAWDWAVDALKSFLEHLDTRSIGEGIRKIFTSINWEKLGNDILNILKLAWEKALDLLWGILANETGDEPPLIKSVRNLGEQVSKFAEDIIPRVKDAWETRLKPEVDRLLNETLPGIIDTISKIIEWLDKMMEKHPEAAVDLLNLALTTLIGIKVAGFFSELVSGAQKAIKPISELVKLLGGAGKAGAAAGGGSIASAGTAAAGATGELAIGFGTLASAAGGGLLAALGLIPTILYDTKLNSDYVTEAFNETGGSAELMAQKMNEFQETASHLDECLNDTTGYTTELGWSMQESRYAAEAYNQFLPMLAETLGLTTEQLQAQIAAAGGDVTQIEALKTSTSGLSQSNNETANSQQNLNNAMDETAAHVGAAADASNQAADNFAMANEKMQQAATETDIQADASYSNVETNVTQKSAGAANAVSSDSQQMESDTQAAFSNIENTTSQTMSNFESTVSQGYGNVAQVVSQKCSEMETAVARSFQDMSSRASESAGSMASDVASRFQEMASNVSSQTDQMSNDVTNKFSNMMNSVITNINNAASQVESRMAQMAQTVQQYSAQMNSSYAANIGQMPGETNNAMGSVSGSVSNTLGGLGTKAGQWGSDMMGSFEASIMRAMVSLEIAMQNVANCISSYLHFSEPDIGPLKNFHTFAPDMMKMYEDGILSGRRKVMNAAASIAKSVSEEFGGTDDVLTNLGENLTRLNGIKNSVNFRMPGAVGGGVIPYSVTDTSINNQSTNSTLESVMTQNEQIMGVLDRILEAIMEGKVISIDKYKFGELLVKTLSNEARARGKSLI